MKHLKKIFALLITFTVMLNLFNIPVDSLAAGKTGSNIEGPPENLKPSTYDISNLELSANKTMLTVGDCANLTLTATSLDGSVIDLTMDKVRYTSSDPGIVRIERRNNAVLAIGIAQGEAYIVASVTLGGKTKGVNIKIQVYKILSSKTRSTYYTETKVNAARKNIQEYDWAKDIKKLAVSKADKYLRLGYDSIWNLVTSQGVPRSYSVNQAMGCPNCGKKIDKFGHYPYLIDPVKNSWKIECPNCHLKFPTNDFKTFYESGIDKQGNFNYSLADKRLLVNKLYPEKGKMWGVDDGLGYKDEKGNTYTLVAYYNHWGLWYNGIIQNALDSFRDAYIYTGDVRYARAGIILLDRIADVYKDMDISAYKAADGFLNSDGGSGRGKIVGSIWECELAKDFLKAYDAFFPAFDDPYVINFLRSQYQKYKLDISKKTAFEIKRNIEDGIVRQIYPAIKKAQIRGNNGMHQSILALAAVIIDTLPETKEWLDFDFQAGAASKTQVTGGNILASLVNDIDRDGNGSEASPQYNKTWISQYTEVADILSGYDLYPSYDLYKNVKFRKMFYAMYPLMLSDIYSALIGDSGFTGSPVSYQDKQQYAAAFMKLNDPLLAQIAYFLNGDKTDGIRGDIFTPDPEKVASDIRKVIDTNGRLRLDSTNQTGYGLSVLRDGRGRIDFELIDKMGQYPKGNGVDTQRDLWMYYGRNNIGHAHSDTLNIGINAFKLDLTPELGYPEYADETANRMEWVRNTISHNTVVVDKTRQSAQMVGQPRHFDDGQIVKLIDVEANGVYPQTSLYRRTSAMIRVDDENSYMVDFFRVKGGNDHYFSFHGAEGSVSTEGLKLVSQVDSKGQPTGTYAGADVEFGIRPLSDSASGYLYTGSGFHWLNNVQRDNSPSYSFSVDWKAKDTWNVYGNGYGADTEIHLKLTMLEKVDDAALADGIPPQNKPNNPKSLKYLIAHRHGENLSSSFTTVIEPYKKESYVQSICLVPIKAEGQDVDPNIARAIKVVLKNGRVDYIINSLDKNTLYTVDSRIKFKGFFGVYSEKDGKQSYGYLNDGSELGSNISNQLFEASGMIVDFTREMNINNEITIKLDNTELDPVELKGKYIYIDNDGARNSAYRIIDSKKTADGYVILDIGDITSIRSFKNINDFSWGYVYDISSGSKFTIPLSRTWQDKN